MVLNNNNIKSDWVSQQDDIIMTINNKTAVSENITMSDWENTATIEINYNKSTTEQLIIGDSSINEKDILFLYENSFKSSIQESKAIYSIFFHSNWEDFINLFKRTIKRIWKKLEINIEEEIDIFCTDMNKILSDKQKDNIVQTIKKRLITNSQWYWLFFIDLNDRIKDIFTWKPWEKAIDQKKRKIAKYNAIYLLDRLWNEKSYQSLLKIIEKHLFLK